MDNAQFAEMDNAGNRNYNDENGIVGNNDMNDSNGMDNGDDAYHLVQQNFDVALAFPPRFLSLSIYLYDLGKSFEQVRTAHLRSDMDIWEGK